MVGVIDAAGPQTPAAPAKARLEPTAVAGEIVHDETTVPGVSAVATRATPAPSGAAVKASATAPPLPSVINLVGSAVFNLFGAATRLVEGPPVLPPGSTVTVRSSTLEIGNGKVVPADWYYPDTEQPPTRLIHLQHGFLASGPMYSYTAAYLAEGTNRIVVAPSLTSNPFAEDAFWLGGDGMHRAVADLFVGDREALTRSAVAAISWINDWFEGRTDVGDDDLVPGSTIDITTPKGTARAIVIGEAPATSLAGYWPDLVA